MTTQYTPGPWKAFPDGTGGFAIMAGAKRDYSYPRVAFVHTGKADAAQLAAAPELLAALKGMMGLTRTQTDFDRAGAAIAKATGE